MGAVVSSTRNMRDPAYLDPDQPLTQGTAPRELFRCCLLRTLLSYTGRSTSEGGTELHPDLAAAIPQITDDGLSWTFELKRGIHYGPPMQDVEITAPAARSLVPIRQTESGSSSASRTWIGEGSGSSRCVQTAATAPCLSS